MNETKAFVRLVQSFWAVSVRFNLPIGQDGISYFEIYFTLITNSLPFVEFSHTIQSLTNI